MKGYEKQVNDFRYLCLSEITTEFLSFSPGIFEAKENHISFEFLWNINSNHLKRKITQV